MLDHCFELFLFQLFTAPTPFSWLPPGCKTSDQDILILCHLQDILLTGILDPDALRTMQQSDLLQECLDGPPDPREHRLIADMSSFLYLCLCIGQISLAKLSSCHQDLVMRVVATARPALIRLTCRSTEKTSLHL